MATSTQGVQLVWLDGYGYRCPQCKLFVAVSKRDSARFCPRCVAEDVERHEDDLYLARAERAIHLWAELVNLDNDAAVERLAEALHEAAEEA